MHSLNDISAVIKHSANILGVNSTSEMGIAVVLIVPTGCADALQWLKNYPLENTSSIERFLCPLSYKKLITNEILGADEFRIITGLRLCITWGLVSCEVREIVFQLGLAGFNLLG